MIDRSMKKSITSVALLLLVMLDVGAVTRNPRRDILGFRLGMTEEAAHRRLRKIGHQQKEERDREREGEQEVWLLRNRRLAYVVLRFNREHELWHITVVAHQGSHILYSEVGDIKEANQATDGRNYTYTWKVNERSGQRGYVVVARGSDPSYLTSYSISRPFQ
jgi:hypothetical protein